MIIDKTEKQIIQMDKEEMQRLLFPNHSIEDIPYRWEEWDKLFKEAVSILKEWNEAKETNKTLATPPVEIFNRVRIIPNLAISIEDLELFISIEDLEVVCRNNGLSEEADRLVKVMNMKDMMLRLSSMS